VRLIYPLHLQYQKKELLKIGKIQFAQYQFSDDVDKRWYSSVGRSIHQIRVITKLPISEQSYKGKVKTHNYINRQNQSTTGKL
jgi:hypothetical protein